MTDWGKIAGPLVSAGATTIGTLIGGPAGALVGQVVGPALGELLGVDPTPEAVSDAITANPTRARAATVQVEAQKAADLQAALEQADVERLRIANETSRAELANPDRFIAYARPFCIWATGLVTLGYGICIVAAATRAVLGGDARILVDLTNLAPALAVALTPTGAVAGVAAWGRTKEKLAGVADAPAAAIAIAKAAAAAVRVGK